MSGVAQGELGGGARGAAVSADITGLYQEVIIDHARSPRNFRSLDGATREVEAINPLCGDHLTLYLQFGDDTVADIAFQGNGCAISQASASLMTMAVKGLQREDALALFTRVHTMLTTASDHDASPADIGKLAVLSGVWEYPARVKCATLAWQALRSALNEGATPEGAFKQGAPTTSAHENRTD